MGPPGISVAPDGVGGPSGPGSSDESPQAATPAASSVAAATVTSFLRIMV
ncbi:hypothetical protein ABQE44_23665 [Mycolicibacterium sp. XJ2546]